MDKKIILTLLLLLGLYPTPTNAAAQEDELWAREFAPKPNQVLTFQGYGDDSQEISFTTIYYARPGSRFEADYWVSEYNIFPEESKDAGYTPHVSVDYYLNHQGLWARTPYARSQGLAPCLVLPYKFSPGTTFVGCNNREYIIANTNKTMIEHSITYESCLEVVSNDGDQLYFMAEAGLVLGLGNDERWMLTRRDATEAELKSKYKIR